MTATRDHIAPVFRSVRDIAPAGVSFGPRHRARFRGEPFKIRGGRAVHASYGALDAPFERSGPFTAAA